MELYEIIWTSSDCTIVNMAGEYSNIVSLVNVGDGRASLWSFESNFQEALQIVLDKSG